MGSEANRKRVGQRPRRPPALVTGGRANRLIKEKSPYLLQHAHNPVDWYPWGAEAFDKARREDKPIFLSIGYSTCHWCHVMERESFEDAEVGRMMDEVFVSIKVDREERPDIDDIYMAVCQMMSGSGGWPLTIIMTSEKKPFFAGTYFPRESRLGRIGMVELTKRIKEIWSERRDEVMGSADEIAASLREASAESAGSELGEEAVKMAYAELAERFDGRNGGFGSAPKFPTPHNLFFLLRHWHRHRDEKALGMVEKTLDAMRRGGIYDHVGFGFHRYSTDSRWLVPHFEKMLYDQALMAMAYTEAYQATGKEEYERTARETFAYVLRDMTGAEGGFWCAEDADSEGEEGRFYLWTAEEVREILPKEEADLFAWVFDVQESGNFTEESRGQTRLPVARARGGQATGRNILHLKQTVAEIASDLNMPLSVLQERLEEARGRLFVAREKRIRPHKDDKVLTDWNGLMIAALAKAAQAFDERSYADAARKAVDFIFANMVDTGGRLLHRYRGGEAAVAGNLDDYAFVIWGFIELYEATFEVEYLEAAMGLNEDLLKHFWDERGGFYFTADDAEDLLVRQKPIYDGAVPSGNSVAMLNLLRLGRMAGNSDFEEKAAEIGRVFSERVKLSAAAHTQLMVAADFAVGPSYEVAVVGKSEAEDTKAMLRSLGREFIPRKVVVFRPSHEERPEIVRLAEFAAPLTSIDGKATAYVCRNYECEAPTTETGKMLELLGAQEAR